MAPLSNRRGMPLSAELAPSSTTRGTLGEGVEREEAEFPGGVSPAACRAESGVGIWFYSARYQRGIETPVRGIAIKR